MTIKPGSLVTFEYTVSDDDGNVIDSNVGGTALQYTHGEGEIVPGLEKALSGLAEGDTKEAKVSPEEGYGDVEPGGFLEVPKDKIPEDSQNVGAALQTTGQNGEQLRAVVSEVKDDSVTLDFNHPLAGKNLHFQVKILKVAEAA